MNKTTLYSQFGGTDCYTHLVREISPAPPVGIFPNPGNTVVRFAPASEITAIKVTDMTGRTCLEVEGVSSDEYLMNLEARAAGLYIAEIETGPGLVAAKLIKE